MERRNFIRQAALASCLIPFGSYFYPFSEIPSYLEGYEEEYRKNPRDAALKWFKEAKLGMFVTYGLFSLLGRHEWVLLDEKIPISEYNKLKNEFTAENFDAEFIADLAVDAGMKYITFVCKFADSFCVWDTKCTDFKSTNSPANRDLVAEMIQACNRRGLGFFAFYEHGFDWRHPHGPSPWDWDHPNVRPQYDSPDPFYKYGDEYDFQKYLDYVTCGITELLTNYGPIAGVWLDGISVPKSGDYTKFELKELYSLIRKLQPQTLISYKYGVTGTEDFMAPEEPQVKYLDSTKREKPWEICTSLHDGGSTGRRLGWGYVDDAHHFSVEKIIEKIQFAWSLNSNLVLNVGPKGDGSIQDKDVRTLKEIGKRIKELK